MFQYHSEKEKKRFNSMFGLNSRLDRVLNHTLDVQFNLGVMYENGRGVEKDEAEAVKWYRKAAEQESAVAQFYLGVMYANGRGVAKDEEEAVKWYRKAAANGFDPAKKALERMNRNEQ